MSYTIIRNEKYGDAIYETSTTEAGLNSWNGDCSKFIHFSYPIRERGTCY